jgi:hypothetical protein
VELALELEEVLRPLAAEREIAGVKADPFLNSGKGIHVDAEIAKAANVSRDTVHKVRAIRKKGAEAAGHGRKLRRDKAGMDGSPGERRQPWRGPRILSVRRVALCPSVWNSLRKRNPQWNPQTDKGSGPTP